MPELLTPSELKLHDAIDTTHGGRPTRHRHARDFSLKVPASGRENRRGGRLRLRRPQPAMTMDLENGRKQSGK
jgi:hypothetical protein